MSSSRTEFLKYSISRSQKLFLLNHVTIIQTIFEYTLCNWYQLHRLWILRGHLFRVTWIRISDPRSLKSCCIKGTNESMTVTGSSVPLMYHNPSDLVLLILIQVTKTNIVTLSLSSFKYRLHTYGSSNSLQKV